MKVVVNHCYGGFGLSYEACMLYAKLAKFKLYAFVDLKIGSNKMKPWDGKGKTPLIVYYATKPLDKKGQIPDKAWWSDRDLKRDDPILVQVVETLGEKANGQFAKLTVTDVPDGVSWEIEEYDGQEWVSETHRTW